MKTRLRIQLLLVALAVACSAHDLPAETVSNGGNVKCGRDTYQQAFNVAFQNAAGDKDAVIVQVLRSFQPEYAIILKRTSGGISVVKATFREQLWSSFATARFGKSREECLATARNTSIDVTVVPLPANEAANLWAQVVKVNLDAKPDKGKRVLSFDGTKYVIHAQERYTELTDVGSRKDLKSENPPLLGLVHSLLHATGDLPGSRRAR